MTSPRPNDTQVELDLTDVERIAQNPQATRLDNRFATLLLCLSELGNLTELTRNDSALLEKQNVSGALYTQQAIDLTPTEANHLRICYAQWKHGYALAQYDAISDITNHSLQFFDDHGSLIHQIMLNTETDTAAFRQLVQAHSASNQQLPVSEIVVGDVGDVCVDQIDINALRPDWAHVHDHHDFIERQKTFDRQRLRKLRMAGKAFAYQVANDSARVMLQRMTDFGTAIMAQVGNAGIVQAYYGKIKNIRTKDTRLKIMNNGFRLLLREEDIDSIWVAKKPTTDGIVTSLELFNRQGVQIASFLSKKSRGEPEPREWRDSIMRLMPIFGV